MSNYREAQDELHLRLRELENLRTASSAIAGTRLDLDALITLIANEASKVINTYTFQIGLFEYDSYRILFWRVRGEEQSTPQTFRLSENRGLINWVRHYRNPLLIDDFLTEKDRLPAQPMYISSDPPRSGLFIPLISGNEVLGIIAAQHPEPHQFTEMELRRLTIFANQAAIALDNALLYERERQRADDLIMVSEIASQVNRLQEMETIYEQVVLQISSRLGFPLVLIMTEEKKTGEFVNRISNIAHFPIGRLRSKAGEGLIGAAIASQEIVVANDVSADSRFIHLIGNNEYDRVAQHTRAEIAIPLISDDQLLGILDVQSDRETGFTTREQVVLMALAHEVAAALDKAQKAQQQRQQTWLTAAQLQIARAIAQKRALDELLSEVARLTHLLLGVPWCAVLLWDEGSSRYLPAYTREVHGAETPQFWAEWPPLQAVHQTQVTQTTHLLPIGGDSADPICLYPLQTNDQWIGAFIVQQSAVTHLLDPSSRREHLLENIAQQLGQAIERIQLRITQQREAAERERFLQELRVALAIQTSLLPKGEPSIPQLTVASLWQAAREVSGDFYDFLPLANDNWGIIIADVAGKGIPAALFMALSRTVLRSVGFSRLSAEETLLRANELICNDSSTDLFVTVFYAIWQPQSSRLLYCNGGHNPPLLLKATGEVEQIGRYGIALGILHPIPLEQHQLSLHPGDVVLFYTDGLTEAMNEKEEQFGLARLVELLQQLGDRTPQLIIETIRRAVAAFAGSAPASDDLTMIAIQVNNETA